MIEDAVTVRRLQDPEDAALPALWSLLQSTFADPDTLLELDRIQAFLAEGDRSKRQFCVVVAEQAGTLLGGTVFSYVPASNCGFSEYLLVRKHRHGQGIGRRLFDARRSVLDELAQHSCHAPCSGVFIEVDNPERTPPDLQSRERDTAMDARVRLQVFAHLGFQRVGIDYVQPALGPGKHAVSYLDLLFVAWDDRTTGEVRVPAARVVETLCTIWQSWAPATADAACTALREQLGDSPVALLPLAPQSMHR